MKKYISLVFAAALTMGFTACEDVPAPYHINTEDNSNDDNNNDDTDAIINAPFSSSLGNFTAVSTVGNYPFAIDGSYGYVKATSYENSTNNAAESWLISPKFSLKNVSAAHVTFDYILRYANSSELKTNYLLRFSENYSGDPAAATWTDVSFNPVQVSDWNTWTTADVNVPAALLGKENLTVALYYKADAKSATWELKNFKLQQGSAAASTDDTESVRTLPYSETFATSLGGFKNYTTSGSGEWTIDYSTAKATGYDNTTKVTTAGTYYIVSPEISLEGQTAAHISYDYILRYNKGDENQQLLITTSFDATKPAEGWTVLYGSHAEGSDWSTFSTEDIAIPAEYMGKKVRIALRYNTNAESGSTWEVKNFAVKAGEPGSTDVTPDTPSTDTTVEGTTYTAASFGLENNTAIEGAVTLEDGTTLTFDGGGNTNTPKFFTNGNNLRMYPKNTLTVTSASKKIEKIYLTCDVVSDVICNASGEVTANPGSVATNEKVLVISDINALSTVITNSTSKTKGTESQIRFTSITIKYAN